MPSLPAADLDHILAQVGELWENLYLENIFVTGGTGFFGRWLVESFAHANEAMALGARMTVLTRSPEAAAAKAPKLAANPAIHFIRGDVRRLDREAVLKQLPNGHEGDFRFVIHAATESGSALGKEDPLAMFDTIVAGTRAALDFAVASGTRRFLFTSSGAVYGPQPPDITHVPETYAGAPDCTRPGSAYGEGKRAAELLCGCYHAPHPALEPVIARCFAFAGPGLPLDAHFAVGNFIRDALRGGPIQVQGDGTSCRSYLYGADLAVWLWTMLFRGRAGAVYNVGSPTNVSILELARTVAGCFSPPIDIQVAQTPTPGASPARYVPDVSLASRELGLDCRIPLADAIGRTIAFHQAGAVLSKP
jgi:dTDP-glucose 4,6-dehydratase